jgi:hypothetical protein
MFPNAAVCSELDARDIFSIKDQQENVSLVRISFSWFQLFIPLLIYFVTHRAVLYEYKEDFDCGG